MLFFEKKHRNSRKKRILSRKSKRCSNKKQNTDTKKCDISEAAKAIPKYHIFIFQKTHILNLD